MLHRGVVDDHMCCIGEARLVVVDERQVTTEKG
jgi:hypothetical protein